MTGGLYETLLKELGPLIGVPNLQPDRNDTCLVKMPSGVEVYIEMDRKAPFLILAANLGSPGPGRYREELFKAALKANAKKHPLHGILAHSDVTDQLILYDRIPLEDLNGDRLLERLLPFDHKAALWKAAVAGGSIPVAEEASHGGGLFGLRP